MSLSVVAGGRAPIALRNFTVHVLSDDEALPFAIDAVVLEEDRWLTLSAPAQASARDANPLRTITRAHEVEPRALGDVVVARERTRPTLDVTFDADTDPPGALVLRAVVIDVDDEPPCLPASVELAVARALALCSERGSHRIRLPLLGCAHGKLDVDACVAATMRALNDADAEAAVNGADPAFIALIVPRSRRVDIAAEISRVARGSAT